MIPRVAKPGCRATPGFVKILNAEVLLVFSLDTVRMVSGYLPETKGGKKGK
jgi:hypothetical protein